jgi:hypothetical protein
MNISGMIAHSTVRIEAIAADGRVSVGTAFFCELEKNAEGHSLIVLVTNKHVIEGAKDVYFHLTRANPDGTLLRGQHEKIYAEHFVQECIPHPDPTVDLLVYRAAGLLNYLEEIGKNAYYAVFPCEGILTEKDSVALKALEEIVMIGYPNGLWDSVNNLPIVRRGITATPVYSNYDGRREFLIDCACWPGSSGSPVVLYSQSSFVDDNGRFNTGMQLILVGILHAGPVFTAEGRIETMPAPTSVIPIAKTGVMMNLGYCINATRLIEFVEIIHKLIEEERQNQ